MFRRGFGFFEYIFAHQKAAERERFREQWGITNENGYDGITKLKIPHRYNEINVTNKCLFCKRDGIVTVYNYGGVKLFSSRDVKFIGDDRYLVEIIDEEIIKEDWGYALFLQGEKLTEDIFKPEWSQKDLNKNGLTILKLADEKDVLVVINRDGKILHKEKGRYSTKLSLYGTIVKTDKGYLDLNTSTYICGEERYNRNILDNGECIFVQTEENCIYQINTDSGKFLIHGKEKEKEKPKTAEEEEEWQKELEERKKRIAERNAEDKIWQQLGRNQPCRCGSGKKFKNCHLNTWKQYLNEKNG